MKPFRPLRDPLFLGAVALYALNQFWWKPAGAPRFFQAWFDDVLLIPAALPLLLWVHSLLGWRPAGPPPTAGEISLHLGVWVLACEVVGPRFLPGVTGDPWDAVAYAAGALLAWAWWHRPSRATTVTAEPLETCRGATG